MRSALNHWISSRGALLALGVSLAVFSVGCGATPKGTLARGQELYDGCLSCHGRDGAGNPLVGAPAIAGQPAWYVSKQLHAFKNGWRAYHVDDITGLRMRPMVLVLRNDDDINDVAAYVATLPRIAPTPTLTGGDAAAGQVTWAVCTACHDPQAAGNEQMHAPPLTALPDWYIVAQLTKFKNGMRGKHPQDAFGAQMQAMSMTLVDEQAMKNVAAYIHTL